MIPPIARAWGVAYGVAASASAVATLAYLVGFVADAIVPRSVDSGPMAATRTAVAVDLAVLALFGLQHSLMARLGFKKRSSRVVPESMERGTYVLLSSVSLAVLFSAWRPIPLDIYRVRDPAGRALFSLLAASGWLLAGYSAAAIRGADLLGLVRVRSIAVGGPAPAADATFQTPWPYRVVRNPTMLGLLVAFWATPRMTAGHLLFAATMTAYVLIALRFEERDLDRSLGEPYRAYRRRVPGLIPAFLPPGRSP